MTNVFSQRVQRIMSTVVLFALLFWTFSPALTTIAYARSAQSGSEVFTPTSPSDHSIGLEHTETNINGGPTSLSVSKATGKVEFSLPVASLSGTSPGYNLNLKYNSNTLAAYQVWNLEAPTNDLGMGFALSGTNEYIYRATKETGYENDDDFFLNAEGKTYQLRLLHSDSGSDLGDEYIVEDQKLNIKLYYKAATGTTPGLWTLVSMDGTRKYYGGSYGNQTRPSLTTPSPLLDSC